MRWWELGCALVVAFGASGCGDETTEPEPVKFSCDAVATGQPLVGNATVAGDDLEVKISSANGRFTEAPTIGGVTSGTLGTVTVENGVVSVPITGVGSSVSFDLDGSLIGPSGLSCPVARTFTVTVNADGATVQ